jgi:uncharacterized protein with HEPN domain/predicted nucleotidyltransferase
MISQTTSTLSVALAERLNVSGADIAAFCQRWQVVELGLFGSVVRDDFGPESDIDVLVVFDPTCERDVFSRGDAQNALAELLGREVDLTEKRLLKNPFSKLEILQTHRIIYPFERANFIALAEANPEMTERVRNSAALLNMIDAMEAIQDFIQARTFEDYLADRFFRSAVERQLEILGEAANRLTLAFRSAHLEVDWRGVVGLRNAIIHQYDELDYEKVWEIVTLRVPVLLEQIRPLLPAVPPAQDET